MQVARPALRCTPPNFDTAPCSIRRRAGRVWRRARLAITSLLLAAWAATPLATPPASPRLDAEIARQVERATGGRLGPRGLLPVRREGGEMLAGESRRFEIELRRGEEFLAVGACDDASGPIDRPSLLQITVPLQPGSSGGPLVTEQGYAVGVVTSVANPDFFLAATGQPPQSVNYAVRSDFLARLLPATGEEPPPVDRSRAIDRARAAACWVEAAGEPLVHPEQARWPTREPASAQ